MGREKGGVMPREGEAVKMLAVIDQYTTECLSIRASSPGGALMKPHMDIPISIAQVSIKAS